MYKISEEMEKLAAAVINEHPIKFKGIANFGISIGYLISDRPKKQNDKIIYGECTKQTEKQVLLSGRDFVITFYADGALLPYEKQKILMEHELMHVGVKEDGTTFIRPHDIEDFAEILETYGVKWQTS